MKSAVSFLLRSVVLVGLLPAIALSCRPSSTGSSEAKPVNEKSTSKDSTAVFQAEYEKWLARAIASGEYCSEETCADERSKFDQDMDYEIQCMVGLADKPELLLGDLNGDAIPDAVATADWTQCDGGNALHTANSKLVFLSQVDGGYQTIEEPDAFGSMDIGGVYEIKDGVMFAQGLAYHEEDPRCCPSLSWEVEYRVAKGEVVESRISEVVREEME